MPKLLCLLAFLTSAPDFSTHFSGLDACFLLHDLKSGEPVVEFGAERADEASAPCSTFKVALLLMALDTGVVVDGSTAFAWDGTKYPIEPWNQDQTAASWIQNSAVWVSQIVVTKLGSPKVQKYLDDFRYGTRDLSAGLTHFWLTKGPVERKIPHPSLEITPREQIDFLSRMWKGELPVSPAALAEAKRLMFVAESPSGWRLHGKTGSGFVGPASDLRLGWFVAHLEKGDQEYVAVLRTRETAKDSGKGTYAGLDAREKMKSILDELGLW